MGLNNFGVVFKQAQKIQEEFAKVQEHLEDIRVTGTAGGGMVEVIANGKQQILNIKIEPEIKNTEDFEMIEDLITAAVNQALQHAQEQASEQMSKVGGGLLKHLPDGIKIPGLT